MKQKLMNKWIAAAVVMMVGLTLSLASASANKSAVTPGSQSFTGRVQKVSVGCQPTSLNSDVATQVKITNTTSQTVPTNTKIYWETNKGLKDSVTVTASSGLPSGGSINDINSDWTKNGPCTAYFYKSVQLP